MTDPTPLTEDIAASAGTVAASSSSSAVSASTTTTAAIAEKKEEIPEYTESEEASLRELPVWIETVTVDNSIQKDLNTITLIAADGVGIRVEKYLAFRMTLIRSMSEDKDVTDTTLEHHLSGVTGTVLQKVVDYIRHFWEYSFQDGQVVSKEPKEHKKIPAPLLKELNEYITVFEKEFLASIVPAEMVGELKADFGARFDLLLACDYLGFARLRHLCAASIAQDHKKKKELDPTCKLWGVKNDFTEEKEATIRKEYAWAEAF